MTDSACCAQCGQSVKVFEPLQLVRQLAQRYAAALGELQDLKQQLGNPVAESADGPAADNIDFHNTSALATEIQHKPLMNWFAKKQVAAEFDYAAVDMGGFYDDAAAQIGQNFDLFQDILGKIAWGYRKNVLNLNIDLKKSSQKDRQNISRICRTFHSYTLFSVCQYNKQDNILFLKLQTAQPVRQFFSGGWLEWFALNEVLHEVHRKQSRFSVARGMKIRFANNDLHELDVVLHTPNGLPVVIECKSGEYRRDLDKYLALRKRLDIPAQNFILLVLDLDEAQAKSLSSMYGLTFVSLTMLRPYLRSVLG